jgi:WD40 repeat protein
MLIPFEAPERFSPTVRFSPGGRRVVVASEDGEWAVVIDVSSGEQLYRFVGGRSRVRPQFLAEDRLLLQTDGGLTAIDLAAGREAWSAPELVGWGAWVNPRRNRVMLDGRGGLRLYDLKNRERVRSFSPVFPGELLGGVFSPDGSLFALDIFSEGDFTEHRYAQLWQVRREHQYRLMEVEVIGNGDQGVMAFSPDNRLLAVSVEGGAVLFDVKRGNQVGGPGGPVVAHAMRFSPGGRTLEIASYDGQVYRSDVETGRVRQHIPAPAGHAVEACAIADRGLAAGVAGAAVLFWQLPEWEAVESVAKRASKE